MAVTLPNPTLTGTIVSTQLDDNFSTLANRFGNITTADISSTAGITTSQLAASYERILVTFKVLNNGGTTVTVNGVAGASLSALAAGTRLDLCPIPGDSSDADWEISDVQWVCSDTGDGASSVRIEWGYFDAVGTWTTSTTPVAAFLLTNANAAQDSNDVHAVNGANTAIDYAHGAINTPRSLALILAVQGAGTLSVAGSFLVVSALLRRKIQAA